MEEDDDPVAVTVSTQRWLYTTATGRIVPSLRV